MESRMYDYQFDLKSNANAIDFWREEYAKMKTKADNYARELLGHSAKNSI